MPDTSPLQHRSAICGSAWHLSWRSASRLAAMLPVCMAGWLAAPTPALAQQCSASGFGIDFGTVSTSAHTDVTASLPYQCQSNTNATYFRVCFFMPGGEAPVTGISPRQMHDYNGRTLNYNVYSDPARTQIIGPPPTGGAFPVYTWDFVVPGGWSQPARTLPVYGRVPPVPVGTTATNYQSQMGGIILQYAWSNSSTPASCFETGSGGGGAVTVGFSGVRATVSNTCHIAIGPATDMDFGSTPSLAAARLATSTITLACPANTSWKVGLNDGTHALAGQRRMAGPAGGFIAYELYRDSGRTQRWGNDIAGGTDTVNGSGASQTNPTVLTVHGRVPAQAAVPAGSYSDTVTVTVTY